MSHDSYCHNFWLLGEPGVVLLGTADGLGPNERADRDTRSAVQHK